MITVRARYVYCQGTILLLSGHDTFYCQGTILQLSGHGTDCVQNTARMQPQMDIYPDIISVQGDP
jgi:hypothetical protein